MSKTSNPDYLILINEKNRLPENFEQTVELIEVENSFGEKYLIEKKTYEAYMRLREDLITNDGIHTELISVYRTIEYQEKNYERYLNQYGPEFAKNYVAIPGHSEHHTGMAIDVGIVIDGKLYREIPKLLELDPIFATIQARFPKYGFILRYPKGKEDLTGIAYESWHFRYLDSPELACEITEKGICFEEYWEQK